MNDVTAVRVFGRCHGCGRGACGGGYHSCFPWPRVTLPDLALCTTLARQRTTDVFFTLYTSLFHGQVWLSVPAAVQFIFTTLASAFTDIVAPDALRKRFYDNPAHDFDFLAPSCILQHGYSESPPVCFIPRSNTPFRIMPRQETFSCRPGQTGQLRVTSWNQTRPQACAFQHDDETSRQSTREVCSLSWEGGGHRPASLRMTVI